MAKTPRRLKGEGSIMQQANGTWRVQVRLPRPPGSTKRPSLVRTGIKRKADAAAVLDELRQQAKTVAAERQTVAGFLQWWLGGPCAELAPGTLDQYRLGVGHIVKAIGRMPPHPAAQIGYCIGYRGCPALNRRCRDFSPGTLSSNLRRPFSALSAPFRIPSGCPRRERPKLPVSSAHRN